MFNNVSDEPLASIFKVEEDALWNGTISDTGKGKQELAPRADHWECTQKEMQQIHPKRWYLQDCTASHRRENGLILESFEGRSS
jgi:hypothetical protein